MLVSEIRRKVKQMPSDGLSLNEIAHRLSVARATVGYRVQVLDEAQRGPVGLSATRYTGPVAPPSVTKARVSRALEAGHLGGTDRDVSHASAPLQPEAQ